ncbi:MAG: hypothetical protein ABI251_03280 [Mycobacteriaceae bacterium]
MDSTEIITTSVLLHRPWLIGVPLTPHQIYLNARDILAGSTGGSMIS